MYRHGQSRRHRALPRVQRSRPSKDHSFWPTFRGALSWMRKNQATLEIAMGLLDIYPSLVQDQALDSVWDFLRPFLVAAESKKTGNGIRLSGKPTGNASRDKNQDQGQSQGRDLGGESRPQKTPQRAVPLISVTLDDDFSEVPLGKFEESRSPRVLLCGERAAVGEGRHRTALTPSTLTDAGDVEELRERLMHEFFLRVEDERLVCGTSVSALDAILDCDVVVFVTSDDGGDGGRKAQSYLSLAWQYDVPVVMVRSSRSRLPGLQVDRLSKVDAQEKNKLTVASFSSFCSADFNTSPVVPSINSSSPLVTTPKPLTPGLLSPSFLSTCQSPAPLGKDHGSGAAKSSFLSVEDNFRRSRCHSVKEDDDGDVSAEEASFLSQSLRNAVTFDPSDAERTFAEVRERIYKIGSKDSPTPKPTLEPHHFVRDHRWSSTGPRTPDNDRRKGSPLVCSQEKDFLKAPTIDLTSSSSSSCSEEDEPFISVDVHTRASGTRPRTPPRLPHLPPLPPISPPRVPTGSENLPPAPPDSQSGELGSVQKDTFYMLVRERGGERTPRLVRWPLPPGEDLESLPESEPDPFLDSPISFQDMDLSAELRLDALSPVSDLSVNL